MVKNKNFLPNFETPPRYFPDTLDDVKYEHGERFHQ